MYMFNLVLIRYLEHLKSYVKNRTQPEGSIVKGYLIEECRTFYSRCRDGIKARFNRVGCVDKSSSQCDSYQEWSIFPKLSWPIGKGSTFMLTKLELAQAHRYVLFNYSIVNPFIEEFKTQRKRWPRSRTRSEVEITKDVNKKLLKGLFIAQV